MAANATIRIQPLYLIHRATISDGTACEEDQAYWRFEETGKTFSEGWTGPEEASKYPSEKEAQVHATARNLERYAHGGLDYPAVIEDANSPVGWIPVSAVARASEPLESKDDAIHDPNATPLDYQPVQGPQQEIRIYLPAFPAILTALMVENTLLGFEPYGYRMNRGVVNNYKHFRTFQPDGSDVVVAFHFENDFETIYTRYPQ